MTENPIIVSVLDALMFFDYSKSTKKMMIEMIIALLSIIALLRGKI